MGGESLLGGDEGNTGEGFSGAKHFLEWDPPPSVLVLPYSLFLLQDFSIFYLFFPNKYIDI